MVKRRKASFIGSEEWRKRDIEQTVGAKAYVDNKAVEPWMTLKDRPSGISTTIYGTGHQLSTVLADLAHRVIQLTL